MSLAKGMAITLCFAAALSARAQGVANKAKSPSELLNPDTLLKRVGPSIFIVEAVSAHGDTLMTSNGVAISSHRILSTKQLLENAPDGVDVVAQYRLRQGSRSWNIEEVYVDPAHDVAYFQSADVQASPAILSKFLPQTTLFLVHFEGEHGLTLTQTKVQNQQDSSAHITSASFPASSAGGGLFDKAGKLAGVLEYGQDQSFNSFVPTSLISSQTIVFSSKAVKHDNPERLSKLWDEAAIVTNNIQTFARDEVMRQGKSIQQMQHLVYGMDKDGGPVQRLEQSLYVDRSLPECFDNWPSWRQANGYMEELRSVVAMASDTGANQSPLVHDTVESARKLWSQISDEYCTLVPGGLYRDLEGKNRACPR